MNKRYSHKVSIVMGSKSDYSTMKFCEKILRILKFKYEMSIVSAHRTPERMFKYAKSAEKNNISTQKYLYGFQIMFCHLMEQGL